MCSVEFVMFSINPMEHESWSERNDHTKSVMCESCDGSPISMKIGLACGHEVVTKTHIPFTIKTDGFSSSVFSRLKQLWAMIK